MSADECLMEVIRKNAISEWVKYELCDAGLYMTLACVKVAGVCDTFLLRYRRE